MVRAGHQPTTRLAVDQVGVGAVVEARRGVTGAVGNLHAMDEVGSLHARVAVRRGRPTCRSVARVGEDS